MTTSSAASKDARTILVVDDDGPFRLRLVRAFSERGFEASGAGDYDEAMAAARIDSPELALVDLKLPGRSGLDVVRDLKELDQMTNIIVLTGYGSIATAVQSVRLIRHASPGAARAPPARPRTSCQVSPSPPARHPRAGPAGPALTTRSRAGGCARRP